MKKLILIINLVFCCSLIWSQKVPEVMVVTPDIISGRASGGNTVHLSIDGDNTPEYGILTNDNGEFRYHFEPPLNIGDPIVIWAINRKNKSSPKITVNVTEPRDAILTLFENYDVYNTPQELENGTTVKKVTVYNTNFSIPLARFNFIKDDGETNKIGDLLLFNSIGAGVGLSAGELTETRDENGKVIHQEFVNTIGGYFGFLFSAGTQDGNKNVFAPILNLNLLDFQIGVGYELGNLSPDHHPVFLTFSYAIPIYTLKRGGYWIWKKSTPVTPNKGRHGI